MFDPASVRIRGPLQAHVQGFWEELLRQGYTPVSAGSLLRVAAHLARWLEAEGLVLRDLTAERVDAFFQHRRDEGYTGHVTRWPMESGSGPHTMTC